MPAAWILPDSCVGGGWASCNLAYDGDTGTASSYDIAVGAWSPFNTFSWSVPITAEKFRGYWGRERSNVETIDIDIFYSGAWHDLYQGTFTIGSYLEYSISPTQSVSSVRVRMYNNYYLKNMGYMYELGLYGEETPPTAMVKSAAIGAKLIAGKRI